MNTISQDLIIKDQVVEQNLYLIFDKAENKITSHILPADKNTNEESQNEFTPYGTYNTVVGDKNKVIIGQIHTHPDVPKAQTSHSTTTFYMGLGPKKNEPGTAGKDRTLASDLAVSVYALATYKGEGGYGNIYKVNKTGADGTSTTPIANLSDVMSDKYNIAIDAIISNFK
jgi:hypothetical protein